MLMLFITLGLLIGTSAATFAEDNCRNDFEDGADSLVGWTKTGSAFDNQPTYGDNLSIRRPGFQVNQHGNFWIGTYENRPKPEFPAGRVQSDVPIGTLTSPEFKITGSDINFLIGGGCDQSKIRAELLIDGSVVEYDTGKCSETMHRVHWPVGKYKGKLAKIRLVDNSSGGWGHLNFDDLKGDIKCGGRKVEAIIPFPNRMKAIMRPTKLTSFISEIKRLEKEFNDVDQDKDMKAVKNSPTERRPVEGTLSTPRLLPSTNNSSKNNKGIQTSTTSTNDKLTGADDSKGISMEPSRRPTSMEDSNDALVTPSGSPTTAADSKIRSMKPSGFPTISVADSKISSMKPSGSPTTAADSKINLMKPSGFPTISIADSKISSRNPSGSPTAAGADVKISSMKPSRSPTTAAFSKISSRKPSGSPTTAGADVKISSMMSSASPNTAANVKISSLKPSRSPATAANIKISSRKPSESPTTAANSKISSMKPSASPTTAANSKISSMKPSGSPNTAADVKINTMKPSGNSTTATDNKMSSLKPSGSPITEANSKISSLKPSGNPTTATNSKISSLKPSGSPTTAANSKMSSLKPSGSPTTEANSEINSMKPSGSQSTAANSEINSMKPSGSPITATDSKMSSLKPSGSPSTAADSKISSMKPSESPTTEANSKISSMKPSGSPTTSANSKISSMKPSGSPSTATDSKMSSLKPNGSPTTEANSKMSSMKPSGSPSTAADSKISSMKPSGSPSTATDSKINSMKPSGSPSTAADSKISSMKPSGSPTTEANSKISSVKPSRGPSTTVDRKISSVKPIGGATSILGWISKSTKNPAADRAKDSPKILLTNKRFTAIQRTGDAVKVKSPENIQSTPRNHTIEDARPDKECVVKYQKVGCFADKQSPPRPLKELLFSEKNQNNLGNKLRPNTKRIVCRCAEEAKKRNFKVFGLQFYDECWSGKNAETNYNVDKVSTNCFNKEFKSCTESDSECVGGPDADYVYKIIQDNMMDPINSTQKNSGSLLKKSNQKNPEHPLHGRDFSNESSLTKDQPLQNFRNLKCKEFLVSLRLPTRWRDDLKDIKTLYYQKVRESLDIKILDLYGEDEDFRGMELMRLARTAKRSISKAYVVLKFDNTDNYLTKLIDALGMDNISAAGCYESPKSCPGSCPLTCAPACQPTCCSAAHQPESPSTDIIPYNQQYQQNSYPTQRMIVYNIPPEQPNVESPVYANSNPPLTSRPSYFDHSSFNPTCSIGCRIICGTQCPPNCCRSKIRNSLAFRVYKRAIKDKNYKL